MTENFPLENFPTLDEFRERAQPYRLGRDISPPTLDERRAHRGGLRVPQSTRILEHGELEEVEATARRGDRPTFDQVMALIETVKVMSVRVLTESWRQEVTENVIQSRNTWRERAEEAEARLLNEDTGSTGDCVIQGYGTVDRIRSEYLGMCGSCDAGLPQSCTCSSNDPRGVISALCDALTSDRVKVAVPPLPAPPPSEVRHLKLYTWGDVCDFQAREINFISAPLKAEIERLRAEVANLANISNQYREHSVTLNTVGWRIAQALGDVREGADQVDADPIGQVDRLINDRDEWQGRAQATRQLANEANDRVREALLGALGIEDDGVTSVFEYTRKLINEIDEWQVEAEKLRVEVERLTADRDEWEEKAESRGHMLMEFGVEV
jgi:hypothetical protein